jgi:hypothetical protein
MIIRTEAVAANTKESSSEQELFNTNRRIMIRTEIVEHKQMNYHQNQKLFQHKQINYHHNQRCSSTIR